MDEAAAAEKLEAKIATAIAIALKTEREANAIALKTEREANATANAITMTNAIAAFEQRIAAEYVTVTVFNESVRGVVSSIYVCSAT